MAKLPKTVDAEQKNWIVQAMQKVNKNHQSMYTTIQYNIQKYNTKAQTITSKSSYVGSKIIWISDKALSY